MQPIPANTKRGAELLYPELSFEIMGLCFDVHNEQGRFSREKQYGDGLEEKLKSAGIPYSREVRIGDTGNTIDFLVNNEIAIELKAKPFLSREDYEQIQRYLQAGGVKLGILVNFRGTHVRSHRVVRIDRSVRRPESDS